MTILHTLTQALREEAIDVDKAAPNAPAAELIATLGDRVVPKLKSILANSTVDRTVVVSEFKAHVKDNGYFSPWVRMFVEQLNGELYE